MTQSKNKNKDLETRLLRALADYHNLAKRHTQDRTSLVKYANQALLDKLLPLLDDLYRAQEHLQDQGLQLVIDHFLQLLSSEDVREVNTAGQPFDPQTMDCTEVVPGPKDTVISVITRGYLHHDRVLRPARVTVGNGHTSR